MKKEQCHDNTHYKKKSLELDTTLYFAEGLPYVAVMTIAVICTSVWDYPIRK